MFNWILYVWVLPAVVSQCPNKAEVLRHFGSYGSHCPHSETWRGAIHRFDPSPKKTIVVTGCSKGYDAIEWLQRFQRPILPLQDEWARKWKRFEKGACGQANDRLGVQEQGIHHGVPSVFCIEPSPVLFRHLRAVGAHLPGFHVQNLVFTGDPQVRTLPFPNGTSEAARIGQGVPVSASTMDAWVKEQRVGIIDVLSLDAEGHDPLILLSSSRLLASNSLRYLEFEAHLVGPWDYFHLQDLINYLDNVGMVCFWAIGKRLFPLTGCWHDEYETKKAWTNVVCAPRLDPTSKPFLPILRNISNQLISP